MKTLILLSVLFISNGNVIGQTDRIDTLISKLDNNKLVGVCNYIWVLKNGCSEVDTLISLSKQTNSNLKPVYKDAIIMKLIPLLTEPEKGIISHYTLTNIWTQFTKQGSEFLDDSLMTIRYTYNELEFYWDKEKNMFAKPDQLTAIRKMWEALIRN